MNAVLNTPEFQAATAAIQSRELHCTGDVIPFSAAPVSTDANATRTLDFLRTVVPSDGYKVIAEWDGERMRHHFVATHEDAAAKAIELDGLGRNVYFACATFKERNNRKAENALAMRSFWVDADVEGGNPAKYPSQREAANDLGRVCQTLQLPLPLIVKSGTGLHAYWTLDDDVDADTWKQTAETLKRVLQRLSFKQDATRTADAASILRPVGTHWRKNGVKPVSLAVGSTRTRTVSLKEFQAALERVEAIAGDPAAIVMAGDETDLSAGLSDARHPYPISENRADFQAALSIAIPHPQSREQWRAGMCPLAFLVVAHDWPEHDARQILDEWSDLAPEANKTNNDREWKDALSRTRQRLAAGDRTLITHLSILKLARAQGWKPAATHSADSCMDSQLTREAPGDILAGRLYADSYRNELLFVSQVRKWLHWGGSRWIWSERGEEMDRAKQTAARVLAHAGRLYARDPERHKRVMAFAIRMQNLARLQAMVELSRSEPGMSIAHLQELDSDPWLLNAPNGVIDLRSGALLAHDANMLITRQVSADYVPDAECPRWMQFLRQIHDGDEETIEFRQRALGYTLTGLTTEEVMFIDYGAGANGKSVFANVIASILADYQDTAPASLLVARPSGDASPRSDIVRTCGVRLIPINELAQGARLDTQVVKMLAGRERISARPLYGEFFTFKPTGKAWLRTNHRPVITDEDDGIWRRILLTPFRRRFTEQERDPWLEQKLLEEAPGILAWMVQGALEWKRGGLRPSALVRQESARYRSDSDLLGQFLDEECELGPNARVLQSTLYGQWQLWAQMNGVRHGSKAGFTRKLSERGHGELKSNGGRYYAGLRPKELGEIRCGTPDTQGG